MKMRGVKARRVLAAAVIAFTAVALYRNWGIGGGIRGPRRFEAPPRNAITFWGHSSVYIDAGGVGVVTDPVFAPAFAPTRRRVVGAPDRAACRGVQLILISHAHADHFNLESLGLLPETATVLCPPEVAERIKGRKVKVMAPWEEYRHGAVAVTAVPARHPGGRLGIVPREDGGAIGFVVRGEGYAVYYSGDTEYFEGMAEIGRRLRPDTAILNINVHLNGDDAARAAKDIGAARVIPAHYGAYITPPAEKAASWHERAKKAIGAAYTEVPVRGSVPLDGGMTAGGNADERGKDEG